MMTQTRAIGLRYWLLSATLLLTFGTGTHAGSLIPLTATLDGRRRRPPMHLPGTAPPRSSWTTSTRY